jgi:protein CpxP
MKKFTITILAIALVALGTIIAIGQSSDKATEGKKYSKHGKHGNFGKRGNRGGKGMRGNHMGRMFRELNLTDEQKAQMKAIRQENRQGTKELRQQMRTNRQQLQQLTENGNFDEAAVTAIASQQGQIHAQMIVAQQKVKAQMYNVLTAEQKTKLSELKAARKLKMQERKAKWAERKAARQDQQ